MGGVGKVVLDQGLWSVLSFQHRTPRILGCFTDLILSFLEKSTNNNYPFQIQDAHVEFFRFSIHLCSCLHSHEEYCIDTKSFILPPQSLSLAAWVPVATKIDLAQFQFTQDSSKKRYKPQFTYENGYNILIYGKFHHEIQLLWVWHSLNFKVMFIMAMTSHNF